MTYVRYVYQYIIQCIAISWFGPNYVFMYLAISNSMPSRAVIRYLKLVGGGASVESLEIYIVYSGPFKNVIFTPSPYIQPLTMS